MEVRKSHAGGKCYGCVESRVQSVSTSTTRCAAATRSSKHERSVRCEREHSFYMEYHDTREENPAQSSALLWRLGERERACCKPFIFWENLVELFVVFFFFCFFFLFPFSCYCSSTRKRVRRECLCFTQHSTARRHYYLCNSVGTGVEWRLEAAGRRDGGSDRS